MQKNQILILTVTLAAIILLLVAGVYFLANSNSTGLSGMMGGTSTTNNWIISLVLIVIAVILSITTVLFFVYPKGGKSERTKIDRSGNFSSVKIEASSSIMPDKPDNRPFDVFLCYKKSSGKDFADHLKVGLEELGLHTFEDYKDIPRTVDTEEGWASYRNRALEQSKYFVLIMTPGFELSSEVVTEIGMARKQANKTFVFFRLRGMGRNIFVNLGNEILDIGKLEQVSFESKEELLRLAHNILLNTKNQ